MAHDSWLDGRRLTDMNSSSSPAKLVLLAVEYAKHSDVDSLYQLAIEEHSAILETDLILRILLTFLPETTPPHKYTELLQALDNGDGRTQTDSKSLPAVPAVNELTDEQAAKRVRKLRLRKLERTDPQSAEEGNSLATFLTLRAYALDEEAGMLNHVTDLLVPFVSHAPAIRTWLASTVIPLCRRNIDYYSEGDPSTLKNFQGLPDRLAAVYLLSQSGVSGHECLGRDLRGLLAPWLYNNSRWTFGDKSGNRSLLECPGWEEFREWLILQGSRNWSIASQAVKQWSGPQDVDFGFEGKLELEDSQLQHLHEGYVRAIMASVTSIAEPTLDALSAAWDMLGKTRTLLGLEAPYDVHQTVNLLPESVSSLGDAKHPSSAKSTSALLRNDLLDLQNVLTEPSEGAVAFLQILVLTAYILTRLGMPYTIRKAGDLVLQRDTREQKGELVKLIRLAANQSPKSGDDYWIRVRNEVLWLQSASGDESSSSDNVGKGAFGTISRHDIEAELLKAMLSQSRFTLAKSLYETPDVSILSAENIQDATFHAALDTFDNASNPNRTKGGLRKCNDIIHALTQTVPRTLSMSKQIEALLSAAHSLSGYRLVLKQGEPFSPIVLRVHSDPIAIIQKVLEQNRGAYTRLQEFLEIGVNMAIASFLPRNKTTKATVSQEEQDAAMEEAESRITAMCISAALKEDDFETAYSYVVSRLGASGGTADTWSWKAALEAGEYIRSTRTQLPTHLGTSSGNPEVRHLEQRLECLATALRIAPAAELQGILDSFRRCEDELDSAIGDEAAKEAAWDMAGDMTKLPGSFDSPSPGGAYPPRNATASVSARQAEESPMSLFDLSRATASVASRNFTSLSSLHGLAQGGPQTEGTATPDSEDQQRVRRRDQLREAATGTLVSGVGWLIGANVNRNEGGPNQ